MANSPWRCAPRASSRLVTLTPVIASSRSTAATTASSAGRTACVTSSRSELSSSPPLRSAQGTRGSSGTGEPAMTASSRAAASRSISGPEPPDHAQVMPPFPAVGRERLAVLERRPRLGRGREEILEPVGHHADDGVRRVVQRHRAAHEGGVAAEALPQRVAEDDDVGALRAIVRPGEVAPEQRCHAERPEVAGAHPLRVEPFGHVAPAEGRLPGLEDRQRGERVAPLRHLAVGPVGDVEPGARRADLRDRHQALRVGIRQPFEQDGIDRAEDGRGGADTERQRQDGERGERRVLPQSPGGVREVGGRAADDALPPVLAHLLAGRERAAQLDPRGAPGLLGREAGGARGRRRPGRASARPRRRAPGRPRRGGASTRRPRLSWRQSDMGYASAFRRRATAPARRVQSAVSAASCFRPARVRA